MDYARPCEKLTHSGTQKKELIKMKSGLRFVFTLAGVPEDTLAVGDFSLQELMWHPKSRSKSAILF
jgi:hypothetical protein